MLTGSSPILRTFFRRSVPVTGVLAPALGHGLDTDSGLSTLGLSDHPFFFLTPSVSRTWSFYEPSHCVGQLSGSRPFYLMSVASGFGQFFPPELVPTIP